MSLAGSHPFEPPRPPPPRRCPSCSCELDGARLCEVCGAADFHGAGLWVCFSCGERNGRGDDRCRTCNKHHVIACPACGFEGFHKDAFCESCGAARAFYPTILRLLAVSAQPRPLPPAQGRALALSLVLAVVALSVAATLGAVGQKTEAAVAGAAGGVAGIAAGLLSRRRQERDPRMLS